MSFSKLRKALGSSTKENTYELVRYCTIKSFTIVGGAGKLLKHFSNITTCNSIISYADKRWSSGGLYKQLGFTLIKTTTPNYWYTRNYTERLHRFGYQKHTLKDKLSIFDENLSEWENMKANGYTRIWDCGHLKYTLTQ